MSCRVANWQSVARGLVVTDDSDLTYPMGGHEFGVRVILVNPFLRPGQDAAEGLRRISVHRRVQLGLSHLRDSQ